MSQFLNQILKSGLSHEPIVVNVVRGAKTVRCGNCLDIIEDGEGDDNCRVAEHNKHRQALELAVMFIDSLEHDKHYSCRANRVLEQVAATLMDETVTTGPTS